MIKVNYNDKTGEIIGFYPDGMGYESIPEPRIEINEEAHQDCINNQGLRRVDLKTLKIVKYTPEEPTTEEIKQQKLAALDTEYQPQFAELAQAWAIANMAKNTDITTARETDLVTLQAEYDAKRSEIENG